ncbi:hypothetical protein Patl1_18169 [Pistacia atlantica]|uniref:Uncharacterized protein n=1 Tax=Pistacia atlantica TaxID=434234 RepID=A0ACC1C049_9ROSI|nr:hypothetical protein Patl1_18169 [Pistacia atlantica]
MFLVDAGIGTPKICMQDELTGVPINRATRFENMVGFKDLVARESLIREKMLERFFIDLVAGESLIKEQAAARFNDLVGSTDVVAGEPLLLLPRKFRQERAWMELNKIWRTNYKDLSIVRNEENGHFEVQWNDKDGNSCMYNADGRDLHTALLHRMSIAYPYCSAVPSFVKTRVLGADNLQITGFVCSFCILLATSFWRSLVILRCLECMMPFELLGFVSS